MVKTIDIIIGDCREVLMTLPDKSVHCCVTSPPYFGLRDYGVDGQIGLESTPEEYVEKLLNVFREVKRVLRDDGTLWLNLGDSYSGSNKGLMSDGSIVGGKKQRTNTGTIQGELKKNKISNGLKPKDRLGTFGNKNESWDQLINRILDEWDNMKKELE